METFSSLTGCITYRHFYVCVREDKSLFYTCGTPRKHVRSLFQDLCFSLRYQDHLEALRKLIALKWAQLSVKVASIIGSDSPFAAQPPVTMAGVCRDDEVVFSTTVARKEQRLFSGVRFNL